jgi:hypothetical protein
MQHLLLRVGERPSELPELHDGVQRRWHLLARDPVVLRPPVAPAAGRQHRASAGLRSHLRRLRRRRSRRRCQEGERRRSRLVGHRLRCHRGAAPRIHLLSAVLHLHRRDRRVHDRPRLEPADHARLRHGKHRDYSLTRRDHRHRAEPPAVVRGRGNRHRQLGRRLGQSPRCS